MQNGLSIQKSHVPPQYNRTQDIEVAQLNAISSFLVILLPVVVICTIVGHRKYKAMVLKRRIHRLNRLWQLDSRKVF